MATESTEGHGKIKKYKKQFYIYTPSHGVGI